MTLVGMVETGTLKPGMPESWWWSRVSGGIGEFSFISIKRAVTTMPGGGSENQNGPNKERATAGTGKIWKADPRSGVGQNCSNSQSFMKNKTMLLDLSLPSWLTFILAEWRFL